MNTFIRCAVASALCSMVGAAHAGFITGAVVGHMMTSSGSTPVEQPMHVASDKHDVIMCKKVEDQQLCKAPLYLKKTTDGQAEWSREVTPEQYAGNNGYRTIHRISVGVSPGRVDYIFMEVSR